MNPLPSFELDLLASVGVFLGALLIYEGLLQLLAPRETGTAARSRRMRLVAAGTSTEQLLQLLKPTIGTWRLARLPFIGTLPADMRQAGLMMKPGTFLSLCVGAAATLASAGSVMVPASAAFPVAILVCLIVPVCAVRVARTKRMTAMMRQLPDALELMARGLKVGHPLNATIASVAREMPDPIGTEFGIIVDQISYGDDLVEAFSELADRVETEDARYLAVSVAIQRGTGGDLAAVLGTLARVIRDRIRMRKKIKALSAEGRLSAWFLSFIPVVILVATSITAPDYYGGVVDDPAFRPLAVIVGVLLVVNALVLRRLVNFRL